MVNQKLSRRSGQAYPDHGGVKRMNDTKTSGTDSAPLHCWWAWARDEVNRRIFRFSVRYGDHVGQRDVVSKFTLESLKSPGGDPALRERLEHTAFKEVE